MNISALSLILALGSSLLSVMVNQYMISKCVDADPTRKLFRHHLRFLKGMFKMEFHKDPFVSLSRKTNVYSDSIHEHLLPIDKLSRSTYYQLFYS